MVLGFLKRSSLLLALALITHISLDTYFYSDYHLWFFLSLISSAFLVIFLFWFYDNREGITSYLEGYADIQDLGKNFEDFRDYVNYCSSIVEDRGYVNFWRAIVFLILVKLAVDAERLFLNTNFLTYLPDMLINLAYLVYVYLIFHPRPEDVDLD